MLNILESGQTGSVTKAEPVVCVCCSGKCQTSHDYMMGYCDGQSDCTAE